LQTFDAFLPLIVTQYCYHSLTHSDSYRYWFNAYTRLYIANNNHIAGTVVLYTANIYEVSSLTIRYEKNWTPTLTRKLSYRKDDRAMRPICMGALKIVKSPW